MSYTYSNNQIEKDGHDLVRIVHSDPPSTFSNPDLVFNPQDLMIVTTLDGTIHGVHKTTRQTIWSTKDHAWGPLVKASNLLSSGNPLASSPFSDNAGNDRKTKDSDASFWGGLMIPEPLGDGNLYYYSPESPSIKKLPLSIKGAIARGTFTDDDGLYVYIPRQVSRLLSIDPLTGRILKSFGNEEPYNIEDETPMSPFPSILISRTGMIYDIY